MEGGGCEADSPGSAIRKVQSTGDGKDSAVEVLQDPSCGAAARAQPTPTQGGPSFRQWPLDMDRRNGCTQHFPQRRFLHARASGHSLLLPVSLR